MSPPAPEPELAGGFTIVNKVEIIPNFHLVEILAPQVARFAKPGQFVPVGTPVQPASKAARIRIDRMGIRQFFFIDFSFKLKPPGHNRRG